MSSTREWSYSVTNGHTHKRNYLVLVLETGVLQYNKLRVPGSRITLHTPAQQLCRNCTKIHDEMTERHQIPKPKWNFNRTLISGRREYNYCSRTVRIRGLPTSDRSHMTDRCTVCHLICMYVIIDDILYTRSISYAHHQKKQKTENLAGLWHRLQTKLCWHRRICCTCTRYKYQVPSEALHSWSALQLCNAQDHHEWKPLSFRKVRATRETYTAAPNRDCRNDKEKEKIEDHGKE